MSTCILWFAIASTLADVASGAIIHVTVPATTPVLARIAPKGLIGLSIEMDRWADWAGGSVGNPNVFLNQALNNLANYTGHAVPLRVGGTYPALGTGVTADDCPRSQQPGPRFP